MEKGNAHKKLDNTYKKLDDAYNKLDKEVRALWESSQNDVLKKGKLVEDLVDAQKEIIYIIDKELKRVNMQVVYH